MNRYVGIAAERKACGFLNETSSHAGRGFTIDVLLRTEFGASVPELRACVARLDDGDADVERGDFLPNRVGEAY